MRTPHTADWTRVSLNQIDSPATAAHALPQQHLSHGAGAQRTTAGNRVARPPCSTKFFLVGWLCLFCALCGRAITLFDHDIPPSGTLATVFSDILANPSDHWSWDLNTIRYKFAPSFDALFPPAALPRIKDQVRMALAQWDTANATPYGTRDDYWRGTFSLAPNEFVDIRSVTVHEMGHVLGFGHPNQGATCCAPAVGRNYRRVPGGAVPPLEPNGNTVQPNTTREVMNWSIGSGWCNHILSWDELDAFNFSYFGRNLNFVEVGAGDPAEIVFQSYHDLTTSHIAVGQGAGALRNAAIPLNGTVVTSATISYNDICDTPIGFRQHGFNWDMICSVDTHQVSIRTRGTDNTAPFAVWVNHNNPYGDPNHVFTTVTHSPFGPNQKDDITHRWTDPGADIPAGPGPPFGPTDPAFHVGLVLDVWDWTVINAVAFDASLNSCVLPFTVGHEWQNGVFASPPPAPESGADGHLTILPGTNIIYARGFSILTSEAPLHRISNLQLADVSGMGLTLSNLNRGELARLQQAGKVMTVDNFGVRTLGGNTEFVVVLQGDVNGLPPNILSNGNYIILNRPDLLDKQLFTFWASSNDEATVGNYGFIGEPPLISARLGPRLRIELLTDRRVRVCWPDPSTGFVLQSTDTLTPPGWRDVNAQITVTNGEKCVTLPASGTSAFYRLYKP